MFLRVINLPLRARGAVLSLGFVLGVIAVPTVAPASSAALFERANRIDWSALGTPAPVQRHLEQFLQVVKADPEHREARIRALEFTFYAWRMEPDRTRRLALVKNGLRLAQDALKRFPRSGPIHYWHGSMVAMLGLTQGVLNSLQLIPAGKASLEKAVELDEGYRDGQAIANMARVYTVVPGFPISLGDKEKGKKMLREGYRKYPNSSYFPLFLADAEWADGNVEAALRLAREAQHKPRRNDYSGLVNAINARKAKELEKLIRSGAVRDRFHDVLSDHEAAGVLN